MFISSFIENLQSYCDNILNSAMSASILLDNSLKASCLVTLLPTLKKQNSFQLAVLLVVKNLTNNKERLTFE